MDEHKITTGLTMPGFGAFNDIIARWWSSSTAVTYGFPPQLAVTTNISLAANLCLLVGRLKDICFFGTVAIPHNEASCETCKQAAGDVGTVTEAQAQAQQESSESLQAGGIEQVQVGEAHDYFRSSAPPDFSAYGIDCEFSHQQGRLAMYAYFRAEDRDKYLTTRTSHEDHNRLAGHLYPSLTACTDDTVTIRWHCIQGTFAFILWDEWMPADAGLREVSVRQKALQASLSPYLLQVQAVFV